MNIADHNKIIAPYICEIDYDGHTLECFGSSLRHEAPEVTQIAFKGIPADIWHILSADVVKAVLATVERKWLQDKLKVAIEASPFAFGVQAH